MIQVDHNSWVALLLTDGVSESRRLKMKLRISSAISILLLACIVASSLAFSPIRISESTANTEPFDSGLIVYWKMEEGAGNRVVDSAGNGHDLFLTSSPSTPQWSTDVPPLNGDNSYSLAFDGVD